ncbi:MAG TPA: DUF4352 domain-containing protein [Chloroflexia bacterium]|nr:DUF4352 domain-containing protein [Chloroflexia bacterium]
MHEQNNTTAEKICPNCRGGNAPAASVCQWCGTRLDSPYAPPPSGYHASAPPPPAPSKQRRSILPVVLLLAVACIALAVLGSLTRSPGTSGKASSAGASAGSNAGSNAGPTVASGETGSTDSEAKMPAPQNAAPSTGSVGSTLETAGLRVTLNSVTRSSGGQFFKPDAGHEYIVLDLTYENTTDREVAVSSLLSASVKDSTGQKYTLALGGADKSSPDGSIAPGDRARGEIAFEVPVDATGLVFTFDPIFGGDPVRFNLSP